MSQHKDSQERRQSERVHRHGHAEMRREADGKVCENVQIMNISEGGVRFVSSIELKAGGTCLLKLPEGERSVKVHHCKPLFKGFAVRGEFVEAAS